MPLKEIKLVGEQKRVLFLPPKEPLLIKGVAGSGKTTVALYRAKHLIDTESNLFQEAKVAIFTYNKTLVKYITAITPAISGGYQANSEDIIPVKPKGLNVCVTNFHKWAYGFIERHGIQLSKVVNNNRIFKTISGDKVGVVLTNIKNRYQDYNIANKCVDFFIEEVSWMKGKVFKTKADYLEAKRTGRGTSDRVTKTDKDVIWSIFTDYNNYLIENDQVDFDDYALLCLNILEANDDVDKPFTHIIIDEAQDLSKAQILVISQLISDQTKNISIIADAAQQIYKSGFTWSEVGLNVRGGRTVEFKKNYRNTIPIAKAAISLLENETDKSEFSKVEAARKGEQKPVIGRFNDWNEQLSYIIEQLQSLKSSKQLYSTVIVHRNTSGVNKIITHLLSAGFCSQKMQSSNDINFNDESIKVCTLSSVKGLEFDNVFAIDLNDDIIPYPSGFADGDDETHISTERKLLYVSMTRARERLYLLSSGTPSRYLAEIDPSLVELI
ncbi:MAG: ATP-dependent helicase [Rikenellaceae bacterium]